MFHLKMSKVKCGNLYPVSEYQHESCKLDVSYHVLIRQKKVIDRKIRKRYGVTKTSSGFSIMIDNNETGGMNGYIMLFFENFLDVMKYTSDATFDFDSFLNELLYTFLVERICMELYFTVNVIRTCKPVCMCRHVACEMLDIIHPDDIFIEDDLC